MMLTITKTGLELKGWANDMLSFGQVVFKVLWDIQVTMSCENFNTELLC